MQAHTSADPLYRAPLQDDSLRVLAALAARHCRRMNRITGYTCLPDSEVPETAPFPGPDTNIGDEIGVIPARLVHPSRSIPAQVLGSSSFYRDSVISLWCAPYTTICRSAHSVGKLPYLPPPDSPYQMPPSYGDGKRGQARRCASSQECATSKPA